jgi:hypothetical protein
VKRSAIGLSTTEDTVDTEDQAFIRISVRFGLHSSVSSVVESERGWRPNRVDSYGVFTRSRSSGFNPIVHVSGTACGEKQTLSSHA